MENRDAPVKKRASQEEKDDEDDDCRLVAPRSVFLVASPDDDDDDVCFRLDSADMELAIAFTGGIQWRARL